MSDPGWFPGRSDGVVETDEQRQYSKAQTAYIGNKINSHMRKRLEEHESKLGPGPMTTCKFCGDQNKREASQNCCKCFMKDNNDGTGFNILSGATAPYGKTAK